MAQAGFTPISLYFSSTASAVPSSGNLANGELGLNIADMKLYAKNSAGTVTLLASSSSTGATVSSVSGTGTVNGLTLTGTVTTSGSLTLGGTLSLVSPPAIGSTTPNTGAFTTLSATTSAEVNGTYPKIYLIETDAATDNKQWWFESNAGVYQARVLNDAISVATTWLSATRSGTTITQVALNASSGGNVYQQINGTTVTNVSSTGLAVTGSLSTTGGATFNGNVNATSGTGNTTVTATNTASAMQMQSNSQDGYLNMTGTGYIYLRFGAGSNLKFTFGPSGQFGVNGSSYGTSGQVLTSGGSGAAPTWSTVAAGGFSTMVTYTSSTTFTIPSGKTSIKVTVVGGGGGARNGSKGGGYGGGGGGGAAIQYFTGLTPGNTLTVTVGAGGAVGGSAGGTTSVSSGTQVITTVQATGGDGAPSNQQGAAGGIGSGGAANIKGGASTGVQGASERQGGVGGSSIYGGGGKGGVNATSNGEVGGAYGGGGGGGAGSSRAGAAGAAGVVIIEY